MPEGGGAMLEFPPPPAPPPPSRAMGGEEDEVEVDATSASSSSVALGTIVTVGFGSVHEVPPAWTDSESPMDETTTTSPPPPPPPAAAPHSPSCLTLTPTVWALHRFEWVLPSQSHTGM